MAAAMKALRKMQAAKGLQMDTVAVPLIGPADALVRVKTASICGTDLHIYGWDRWSQGRIKPPVTLGHEFCGVVERVGEEVTAVEGGGFVRAEKHGQLGRFPHCPPGRRDPWQKFGIIRIDHEGRVSGVLQVSASANLETDPGV